MKKRLNNDICVIVPCFNEEDNILKVLDDLSHHLPGCRIVVINDASTDGSAKKVSQNPLAELISLPCNLGIGGTVQTGLKYAARHGFKYAVKFDGDGQHKASEIASLMKPVLDGIADVSIGSRFIGTGEGFQSTLPRRIGIGVFRILNSLLIGQIVTDNTSGFRAYNELALNFLARHYPSFDYPEPEEVVLLGRNSFRITEVSTPMEARNGGVSSINTMKSVYYMIKVILAILMVSIRPKLRRR